MTRLGVTLPAGRLPSTAHSISRASGHRGLDDDLAIELERELDGGDKLGRRFHFRDADTRSEIGRLHEQRETPASADAR